MAGLCLVYFLIINSVLVEAVGRDCEQKNTEGNSTSDTQIDVKCETVLQKPPTQIQQTKTQINTKQNSITLQINPNLPKTSYEKFIFYPRTTTTKSTLHQESKPQSNTVSSKVRPTTSSTLAVTLKLERTTILSNIPLIIPEPKTTQIQQTINQIETQLNSITIETDPTVSKTSDSKLILYSRQNTGVLNAPSPSHQHPLLVSKEYQPNPETSTTMPDTTSTIFPGSTSTTMPDTTSTTMSDNTSTTLPDTTSTTMSDTTSTTLADTTSTTMPDTTSATMSDTTTMPDTTSTTLLDTTSRVVLELGPTSTIQQEPTAQPTVIMPTTLSLTTASTRVIPSTPKAELTSTISQKDALNKTATKSPMPDNKSNTVASKPINPSILTNTIDKGHRTLADKLPGVITYDTSSTNIPVAAIIGGVGGVLLLGLTAVLLFIFIRKCPRNKIIEEAVTTYSSVDSTTKIIIPRPSYTRHLDTNSTYYQEISAVSSRENLVQMNSWRGSV
ncbi:hypothetical protein SNE40_019650 [Patella caerulea]|uniref:Uncharacterized protein n=1 Tax=Patella caerulea TaxID=87958 RepID=A0AAN8P9Z2_PATCE